MFCSRLAHLGIEVRCRPYRERPGILGFAYQVAYKCAWNDICKTSVIEQMERNVKASILSYYPVPDGAEVEVHRFMFCLEDGITIPHAETISLRTARVLVAKLDNGNAFVRMLREIVRTEPAQYDTLIGRSFTDQLFPIVPSSRRSDREA